MRRDDEELRARAAAVGCMVVLGVIAVVLWVFFSPPDEARDAVRRLDSVSNPNPVDRIDAIQVILRLALEGKRLSGWQQIQEKGCRDPNPQVRVTALRALGKFTKQRPNEVVKTFGGRLVYLNIPFLAELGRSDPEPTVRAAVADFWAEADVLGDEGVTALDQMLTAEKDEAVVGAARRALTHRIEVGREVGSLDEKKANELRQRYNLGVVQRAEGDARRAPAAQAPNEGEKSQGEGGFITGNPWRMRTFGMFVCVAYGLTFRRIKQGADAQTPERQQAGCVLIGVPLLAFLVLTVWVVVVDGWLAAASSIGIAVAGGFVVSLVAGRDQ